MHSAETPVYISNRVCANVTVCSNEHFVVTPATATTDAACGAIRGVCGNGETQVIAPVPGQTDRRCAATSSGRLSAGDDVGITLGVGRIPRLTSVALRQAFVCLHRH